jgi:hypothetical protein
MTILTLTIDTRRIWTCAGMEETWKRHTTLSWIEKTFPFSLFIDTKEHVYGTLNWNKILCWWSTVQFYKILQNVFLLNILVQEYDFILKSWGVLVNSHVVVHHCNNDHFGWQKITLPPICTPWTEHNNCIIYFADIVAILTLAIIRTQPVITEWIDVSPLSS